MTDVTIIGGGPAGSSVAIRLARTGRRVTLFEKTAFPRAKLCGGFMSGEALEDLAELDVLPALRRAGAVPLRRTVLASPRGTVVESELPTEALSVSRDILDHLLIQEAIRRGVEVRFGQTIVPPAPADCGAVTVIATGRQASPLAHRPWYATSPTDYFGIQATFLDVRGVTDQVELDLVEGGYVGLSRQQDGVVNVCTLTTQDALRRYGPSLDAVMRHFMIENPVLKSHLCEASRGSAWMAVGPVRLGVKQLAHGHTFYVGDAACVVDPFVGEGMSIGLYTSRLVTRALDQTRLPPAQAYAALWKQAFVPALRWNALMRLFYSAPLLREPALRALQIFPSGLRWMAELTRHRELELS